jgi:hypothetical protein
MGTQPLARTEGLLTEQVDDELLVFDAEHKLACRLNASAALVWRSCDGTRSLSDLVAIVAEEFGEVADEDQVVIALDSLVKHGLIESGYEPREAAATRITRRRFMRRVGAVSLASFSVPLVSSMMIPSAAAAASAHSTSGITPSYGYYAYGHFYYFRQALGHIIEGESRVRV